MGMKERMKGARQKPAFRAVIVLLIVCAVAVVCFCPKRADSLLKNKDIGVVEIFYVSEEGTTPKEQLCIKAEQPAMDEVRDFLENTYIMWCGFCGKWVGSGYHLAFLKGREAPRGTMYITKPGYLHCGNRVYRVIAPASENMWLQLDALYESASDI